MDLIHDFDLRTVFQLSIWENKNIFVIQLYFLFNISIISNWEKIIRPLSGLRTWHLQKPIQQNPENGRNISLFPSPSWLGSVLSPVRGPISCKLIQKYFSLFHIKESQKIDIIKGSSSSGWGLQGICLWRGHLCLKIS